MERAFDTVRPLLLAPDQFGHSAIGSRDCPFPTNTMTVTDRDEWERVVQISLTGLDRFVRMYEEDGACDEGPAYWCSAGGSLYNACLVLRDMTGGRWNPFDHPLKRSLSVNPTSMQKGIGNEI